MNEIVVMIHRVELNSSPGFLNQSGTNSKMNGKTRVKAINRTRLSMTVNETVG